MGPACIEFARGVASVAFVELASKSRVIQDWELTSVHAKVGDGQSVRANARERPGGKRSLDADNGTHHHMTISAAEEMPHQQRDTKSGRFIRQLSSISRVPTRKKLGQALSKALPSRSGGGGGRAADRPLRVPGLLLLEAPAAPQQCSPSAVPTFHVPLHA